MARIRKIHRICQTRKESSENNSDSEIDNSTKSSRFSIFNGRKIKLVGRTRRVYQHLKNCTDNFNNISNRTIIHKKSLSCSLLSDMDRNRISYDSKFTQTSEKDILQYAFRKISNSSTQTEPLIKDENIMKMNELEMIELDISSASTNPSSVKSQLENSTSSKTNMEKEDESSEEILSKNSRNGKTEGKIALKNSIVEHTNQNEHKNEKMTPSKIPIPLKYLPKTKWEEIKQQRKKKINFFLKKKSRKLKNFHNDKTIEEKVKLSSNYERKLSLCDEFFNKMKKYSEMATEWSMRILKLFSDLGISLKKNLSNIYEFYDAQTSNYLTFCECDRYRQEVIMLGCKMKELEYQIKSLSGTTIKKSDNADKHQEIFSKLNKIDEDVQSFVSLKTEIAVLKKQLEEKYESSKPNMPPFPPPPPPLPPPPTICYSTSFMKVRQDDRKLSKFNESRPIITLEDILKVKLKKISLLLNRKQEETIMMEIPKDFDTGTSFDKKKLLKIGGEINGLKQSSRIWYKEVENILA